MVVEHIIYQQGIHVIALPATQGGSRSRKATVIGHLLAICAAAVKVYRMRRASRDVAIIALALIFSLLWKVGELSHRATMIGLVVDLDCPLRLVRHGEGSANQVLR